MSLINIDSFAHYTDVTQKYSSDSTAVITAGVGRHGLAGMVTDGTTFFRDEFNGAVVSQDTLVNGIAIQFNSFPASLATIFQYLESDNTEQIAITIDSTGLIAAYRGNQSGTLLATAADPLVVDTYYYIECQAFINNSGTVEVRVWTSALVSSMPINFSGDTQNGGTRLLSKISYGVNGSSPDANWSDKYTCDTQGNFNDFLGNKRVTLAMPQSAGFYTQWQPFPSAPNFANVDENPPDGDTSYNFAPSVDGDTDTFTIEDTMLSTVDAVAVNLCSELSADGATGVAAVMRYNNTDSVAEPIVPTTEYLIYQFPYEIAADGSAWTPTVFNASQAGYTVFSETEYWLLPYLSVYAEGTAITIATPNEVRVLKVFVPYKILVSRLAIKIGVTDAGKFWGTGLYTEAGDLFIDSGPISTAVSGFIPSIITPVILPAGTYWYAWTCDSSTPTVATALIDIQAATIREGGAEQYGHVANPSVAGQLPATLGAFTAESPVTSHVPVTGVH